MPSFKSIVVLHPGAIGDAVMGTPVPRTLRANYPEAKIIYLTHPSLFPLLELSGAIDVFIEWNKETPIPEQVASLKAHQPDLLVDLVASLRTRLICLLTRAQTLAYRKERNHRTWRHVVDNYLDTLAPLQLTPLSTVFPTLQPPPELVHELKNDEELRNKRNLVALVPGVGKHRPNRSWPAENWAELGKRLIETRGAYLVLVGGSDDEEACQSVSHLLHGKCLNLAGKMSLVQTTALLSMMDFVVSADTGPAHLAAAVGKPVICLMGPTDPKRTGPYHMENIGLYAGSVCECTRAKHCLKNDGTASGECMKTLTVDATMSMIASFRNSSISL
jgi:heptosyltransferase-1